MGIMRPIRKTPDFNPRSPCGERRKRGTRGRSYDTFQSTLSLRRATLLDGEDLFLPFLFQSTLSLRRATRSYRQLWRIRLDFNPRSPCGERQGQYLYAGVYGTISIHALLAESDPGGSLWADLLILFQSTLSLRRATTRAGETPRGTRISIHALLAESDDIGDIPSNISRVFQSTLSLRRATGALHPHNRQPADFNPRSPCGERRTTHDP